MGSIPQIAFFSLFCKTCYALKRGVGTYYLAEIPLAEIPLAEISLAKIALAEIPLAKIQLAEISLAEIHSMFFCQFGSCNNINLIFLLVCFFCRITEKCS